MAIARERGEKFLVMRPAAPSLNSNSALRSVHDFPLTFPFQWERPQSSLPNKASATADVYALDAQITRKWTTSFPYRTTALYALQALYAFLRLARRKCFSWIATPGHFFPHPQHQARVGCDTYGMTAKAETVRPTIFRRRSASSSCNTPCMSKGLRTLTF
jgi:hypothetical protein